MRGIYECICSFMLFTTTIFKTISVKEMKPTFVKMKISRVKKNKLQVVGTSVPNKRREEILDFIRARSCYFRQFQH